MDLKILIIVIYYKRKNEQKWKKFLSLKKILLIITSKQLLLLLRVCLHLYCEKKNNFLVKFYSKLLLIVFEDEAQ